MASTVGCSPLRQVSLSLTSSGFSVPAISSPLFSAPPRTNDSTLGPCVLDVFLGDRVVVSCVEDDSDPTEFPLVWGDLRRRHEERKARSTGSTYKGGSTEVNDTSISQSACMPTEDVVVLYASNSGSGVAASSLLLNGISGSDEDDPNSAMCACRGILARLGIMRVIERQMVRQTQTDDSDSDDAPTTRSDKLPCTLRAVALADLIAFSRTFGSGEECRPACGLTAPEYACSCNNNNAAARGNEAPPRDSFLLTDALNHGRACRCKLAENGHSLLWYAPSHLDDVSTILRRAYGPSAKLSCVLVPFAHAWCSRTLADLPPMQFLLDLASGHGLGLPADGLWELMKEIDEFSSFLGSVAMYPHRFSASSSQYIKRQGPVSPYRSLSFAMGTSLPSTATKGGMSVGSPLRQHYTHPLRQHYTHPAASFPRVDDLQFDSDTESVKETTCKSGQGGTSLASRAKADDSGEMSGTATRRHSAAASQSTVAQECSGSFGTPTSTMMALSPASIDSRASVTPPEKQPLRRQLGTQHANSLLARLDAMKQKWASPIPEEEDSMLGRTETPPMQQHDISAGYSRSDAAGSAFSTVPCVTEERGEERGESAPDSGYSPPFVPQEPQVVGKIVFCGNRAFPPFLTVHLGPNSAPVVLEFSLRSLSDYTALCKEFNVTMNFADASLESSGMGSQVILECCMKRVLGCEAGEQAFETPVLGPNDHYQWTVAAAGEYDVHDATFPFNKATVHVRDFPSPPRPSPAHSSPLTMRRKPGYIRAVGVPPPSIPARLPVGLPIVVELPVVELPARAPCVPPLDEAALHVGGVMEACGGEQGEEADQGITRMQHMDEEDEEEEKEGERVLQEAIHAQTDTLVPLATPEQAAVVPVISAPPTFGFAWQCTLLEWLLYLLSPILLSPAPLLAVNLLMQPGTGTNVTPVLPTTTVCEPVKTHALRSVNEQLEGEGLPPIALPSPLCHALLQHYHVTAKIASGVAVYSVRLRGTDYRLRRVCGLYSSLSRPLLQDLSRLASHMAGQTPDQWPPLF